MRLSLESLLSSRTRSGWAAFHALAFASFSALRVSGVGVWSFIMRSWAWVLFSAMWASANEGQLSLWASDATGTRLTLYGFCRRPAAGDTVGDCAALYARLGAPLVEGEGFGSDGHLLFTAYGPPLRVASTLWVIVRSLPKPRHTRQSAKALGRRPMPKQDGHSLKCQRMPLSVAVSPFMTPNSVRKPRCPRGSCSAMGTRTDNTNASLVKSGHQSAGWPSVLRGQRRWDLRRRGLSCPPLETRGLHLPESGPCRVLPPVRRWRSHRGISGVPSRGRGGSGARGRASVRGGRLSPLRSGRS